MAAQYIPIKRVSSLDVPITAEKLDGSLFTTENQAHEFIISVRKNGVKQTITGGVTGKFIRANGTTIFLQGSISNGDAVVRLHRDCYNVQGRFTFNIFNSQNGVTTCIYSAVGKIDLGSTETVIDAGDVVPDVTDVIAAQETMKQELADAVSRTNSAIAGIQPQIDSSVSDMQSTINSSVSSMQSTINSAVSTMQSRTDTAVQSANDAATAANQAADAANQAAQAGDSKFVRYDAVQTLTDDQKSTARTNIDSPSNAEITELKSALTQTEAEIIETAGVIEELECELTDEVKAALLACFTRVAWIDDDGQTYYNALSEALNRSRVISSISAVFTQGSATIYDTDELYALKQYLTVTVTYSDGTTKQVNNYTLSGNLVAGTSTITVAYNKKTTTFNVTVTHQEKTLESISATFNSSASITTDNVLDDLRPYLTVLATYSDSSTNTITNYTLSGSLNVGTNTITVTYGGKKATFTVAVTDTSVTVDSISCVYTQSGTVYDTDYLDVLRTGLTVTAYFTNGTEQVLSDNAYELSGLLSVGTSTITVSYSEKTSTFTVTVTEADPLTEISDSWDTILANIDNGTYRTRYKVKNYKPLDLGSEGTLRAQIIAMDTDTDEQGNTIPITIFMMEGLPVGHGMEDSDTNLNHWVGSKVRNEYLNGTIYNSIQANVRSRIVAAEKISKNYVNGSVHNSDIVSYDKIWLGSVRELYHGTSGGADYEEYRGVQYTSMFPDDNSRIRNPYGKDTPEIYWTRTDNSWANTSFRIVRVAGELGSAKASIANMIVFGFCLGRTNA